MLERTGSFYSKLKIDLLKWLLFIAIIVAPLRAYSGAEVGGINLSLFRMAWLMTMLGFAVRWLSQGRLIIPSGAAPFIFFIWMMIFALVVSFIFSPYKNVGDTTSRFGIRLFGFFFVILFSIFALSKKGYVHLACQAFAISALLPVLIGIYQFFTYQRANVIPALPLMKFSLVTEESLQSLNDIYGPMGLLRINSTLMEPNYLGIYLSSVVLIAFGWLIHGGFGSGRLILKAISWSFLGLSLIVLLLTFSLSAMFGLSLGLVTLAWCTLKKKRFIKNLLIGLLIIILVVFIQHEVSIHTGARSLIHMVSYRVTLRWQSASVLFGRDRFFMRGFERFAESPFVGGGAGALADLTAGRISSAHNTFLTIMSEQGLLGFVPMAGFFALVIISLYRKNRLYMFHGDRQMAGLSAGLLSALVALLGAVQFYDALYSFDPNWILLSLAVACVISPMHVVRNKTLLPRR